MNWFSKELDRTSKWLEYRKKAKRLGLSEEEIRENFLKEKNE